MSERMDLRALMERAALPACAVSLSLADKAWQVLAAESGEVIAAIPAPTQWEEDGQAVPEARAMLVAVLTAALPALLDAADERAALEAQIEELHYAAARAGSFVIVAEASEVLGAGAREGLVSAAQRVTAERDRAIESVERLRAEVVAARIEGAEAARDAAMSVADDLVGGTPEASDCEWAHELMERVAAAVAKIRAKGSE